MPEVVVNGNRLTVATGITVAAALYVAGEVAFRTSATGEPRAPLCGMGICMECRVTINGVPHQRSCLVSVVDGMVVETS